MEHYSAAMWLEYVEGSLDEDQALVMEQHLTKCDKCLELYASAAENYVCQQVSSQFTDEVMTRVLALQVKDQLSGKADQKAASLLKTTQELTKETPRKTAEQVKKTRTKTMEQSKRWRKSRQALGNYAIAACLTLLLTAGGIFGGVASAVAESKDIELSFADKAAQKVGSGWSQIIAEKTLSILDIVTPD